ncbi:sigma-70 family RNA polymerase sigma factor [Actinocrinis puniceicyclus]|uniref:RNA polymerase sigma factor n=1 Tax=Actinocrinis puniceicyclus TaxID=977794 RepID=A0A8J7WPD1_9ACTN|nr:sigma-70 family RNA polymerase sigma factor [Actinocrinis puniceicyclus]MBS2963554.1 sigma-70 family RNA polymerase sigma factor [Actinocrinis puniceicyclus]
MDQSAAAADERAQAAFARYVLPEIEVLYRVALSITAQPADAEDLVQDTLLRAYRAVERFDGTHARAWLLTILRNTEINRHRRRRPDLLDDPDAQLERHEGRGPFSAPAPGPEELVVEQVFDKVVDEALAALPVKHRQVVQLVDIDGLTYAEAATLLEVPEGTVMSRLHRARKRIRDRLAAAGLAPTRSGR